MGTIVSPDPSRMIPTGSQSRSPRITMASTPFPFQCLLLKTGQTTQYSSELDDGYYQAGIAKSYTVLTTGQYSGTKNVDLIHYAAATISFDSATKEIRDSANGMAIFKTADVIVITGSGANDGVYTVATGNVAAKAVVTEALVDEAAGATVSIAKRESKSNNCVVDNNTGLMWLRDPSNYPAKMGAASNGLMEWTDTLYDIFAYCAAVNAAAVGGYSDWRVMNAKEWFSIVLHAGNGTYDKPDGTAFPNVTSNTMLHWTSSTDSNTTTMARCGGYQASVTRAAKTTAYYAMLVRSAR